MILCASCPYRLPDATDATAVILEELRAACRAWEIVSLPGERVRKEDAARLLDRQQRTLDSWRYEGIGPAFVRGHRPTYALAALAAYLAAERTK